jgi:hypothetical protein
VRRGACGYGFGYGRGARLRFGRDAPGVAGGRGEAEFRRALEIARARGRDLAANAERPADKSNGEAPNEANAEISRAGGFRRVS